jgi:uncharacterized protein YxjI
MKEGVMTDSITTRNQVFVKELVGYFKAANAYELYDEGGDKIGEVKEDVPGAFRKMLKFTGFKTMLPFTVNFYDGDGKVFMTVWRKFSFFRSKVFVKDADERQVGQFKQKMMSLGGKFEIQDNDGQPIGMVKGDWKGWDFKVSDAQEQQVGQITKKWAGIGKEMFTSADNYVISVDPNASTTPDFRKLVYAAGICIDMVLKEQGR